MVGLRSAPNQHRVLLQSPLLVRVSGGCVLTVSATFPGAAGCAVPSSAFKHCARFLGTFRPLQASSKTLG
jgi:hypothetical protein